MDLSMITLADNLWVIICAALVFFMQPGFSMLESGMTREKNSINVAIKNLTDIGLSSVMYWICGFAFMFGSSKAGFIGLSHFFPGFTGEDHYNLAVFLLFQMMFCSTSATIGSGAVADRMKYSSYIVTTILISSVIYPVFGHWAWGGLQGASISSGTGWLSALGFVDFAGSTVVHSVGGYVGLAGIIILGSRKGRFTKDGKSNEIQGSNIPLAVAGVFILWFGWIGFNGGSTLAFNGQVPGIILNTCLASASGLIFSLALGWIMTGIPNVNFVLNGSLAGLVAITAGCHAVSPAEAIIIGAVGGAVMLFCTKLLDALKLDDAVGAIPVHLAAGIWGTLAVGIFGDPAVLMTDPVMGSQFLAQLIGVASCGVWAFGLAFISLKIVNAIHPMRVSSVDEDAGLNIAEHGASTQIFDLYSKMESQAETGDLSVRLPEDHFTEIGQIAHLYNKVMDNLEGSTIAKSEYDEILTNVSDGLLLINEDCTVCPNYSAASERLLCCRDLEGRSFLLLMSRFLGEQKLKGLQEFLPVLFNMNYKNGSLDRLNPLGTIDVAVHRKVPGTDTVFTERRKLSFIFKRIYDKHKTKILHSMVIIKEIKECKTSA